MLGMLGASIASLDLASCRPEIPRASEASSLQQEEGVPPAFALHKMCERMGVAASVASLSEEHTQYTHSALNVMHAGRQWGSP